MKKIADFIVTRKIMILIIVLIITVISIFLIPKVKINYDTSKYLPNDSEVSQGLKIMEDEFGLIDNVQVLVKNITKDKSSLIYNQLLSLDGVKAIQFDVDSEKYFKDNDALFVLMIDKGEYNQKTEEILTNIRTELKDFDIRIGGSAVVSNNMNNTLKSEMPIYCVIAAILILIVLLVMAKSWFEPILFLSISGIAILINYGTNIIFGEISFVTFAIAAVLQLALAMDYSIMLLDQYHYESKENSKEEAMKKAWRKSFSAISASSLTTIFGLLAMLFMSFTIGRDLGLVLAKGILMNVLVVFLAFPALILISEKLLNKTEKKALKLPTKFLINLGFKGKYVISILMIFVIIGTFFIQSNLKFTYSLNSENEETKEIVDKFGNSNQFVFIYKQSDNNKIKQVLQFINDYEINDKKVVDSVIDYNNTIALPVSVLEIVNLTNMDEMVIQNIFNFYNQVNQTQLEKIPVNDLLTFIEKNVLSNPKFATIFDEQTKATLNMISKQLLDNKTLLSSTNFNRMIITINADVESEIANNFYKDLKNKTSNFSESYVLGQTALLNNIESSFADETILIMILTVISMIVVIAIVYRSIGLPFILVALIQGAIWISLCYPVVLNYRMFFLAYIIVQCIQMGATIDYAILLSSHYMNNCIKQNKLESISGALKASVMTIFTSATILIVATFTIAIISSQPMISDICMVIGRGTIISTLIVLIVLPACLVVCDKFLQKTTFKRKMK